MNVESPSSYTDKNNLNNNKKESLGMIDFNTFNQLTMASAIKQSETIATTFHKPAGEANSYAQFGYNL